MLSLQTSVQMLSVSAVSMVHALLQETCLDEGMHGEGESIERVKSVEICALDEAHSMLAQ